MLTFIFLFSEMYWGCANSGRTWPRVDMSRNGCFTSRDYGWSGRAATWCFCDQHLCNNVFTVPRGQTRGQSQGQSRVQTRDHSQGQTRDHTPQPATTRRNVVTPAVPLVRRQGQGHRLGQRQRQNQGNSVGHRRRLIIAMSTLNDQNTQVTRSVPVPSRDHRVPGSPITHRVVFIHRIPVPTLRPRTSSQNQGNNNQQQQQQQQQQPVQVDSITSSYCNSKLL